MPAGYFFPWLSLQREQLSKAAQPAGAADLPTQQQVPLNGPWAMQDAWPDPAWPGGGQETLCCSSSVPVRGAEPGAEGSSRTGGRCPPLGL